MALHLCDLFGRDEFRFSPYVWRTRMALAHKGLEARIVGITLTDKSALDGWTDYRKAPVLNHDGTVICDSWCIAEYLDATWPERPGLFPDSASRCFAHFLNGWVVDALYPRLLPMIAIDVLDHVHPSDRAHYRTTRETRLGRTLELAAASRDDDLPKFRDCLAPVRIVLAGHRFLCGDAPSYADYILFGLFQWARCTSALALLEDDDPVHLWRGRLLDLFNGLGGQAPGYPC